MSRAEIHTTSESPELVVVIPTLNEAACIAALIRSVLATGAACIVSDGGSTDDTVIQAGNAGAGVVSGAAGRAHQMNRGARFALERYPDAPWLLFLHADVRLPAVVGQFDLSTSQASDPEASNSLASDWIAGTRDRGAAWARFDVTLVISDGAGGNLVARCAMPIIAWFMNWRSAVTGICTGDQGLLVQRPLFDSIGGFPEIALMEDIEISSRLRESTGRPHRISQRLRVSARRWERNGIFRTIGSMWWYRLRYFFGVSAEQLHREYYGDGADPKKLDQCEMR